MELSELCLAIQRFREAMEGNMPLDELDRICLENYISLLEITYIEWKRRNLAKPASRRRAA